MVFKKDLTPLRKGGPVIKHRGKGSAVRQPDPMATMTNRYPKAAPEPAAPQVGMPGGQMSLPFDEEA